MQPRGIAMEIPQLYLPGGRRDSGWSPTKYLASPTALADATNTTRGSPNKRRNIFARGQLPRDRSLVSLDARESLRCLQLLREESSSFTDSCLQEVYETLSPCMFRLLALDTDDRRPGVPKCTLKNTPLDDTNTSYVAISYTWIEEEYHWYGRPLPRNTWLLINEKSITVMGPVALILSLLFRSGVRAVWIDTICINQLDHLERGHQVANMSRIYSSAKSVAIFLGRPSTLTDLALAYDCGDERQNTQEVQQGFLEILFHRYFHRSWILQEIANAKMISIHCGNLELAFPASGELFHLLATREFGGADERVELSQKAIRAIDSFSCGHRPDIIEVLEATDDSECGDSRDILYAKLALARNPDIVGIPDYSVEASTVFTRFAIRHMKATNSLNILNYTQGVHRDPDLPTWVPDWRAGRHVRDLDEDFEDGSLVEDGFHPFLQNIEEQLLQPRSILILEQGEGPQRQSTKEFGEAIMAFEDTSIVRVNQHELIVSGIILKRMCSSFHIWDDNDRRSRSFRSHVADPALANAYLCQIDGYPHFTVLQECEDFYKLVNLGESIAFTDWAMFETQKCSVGWFENWTRISFRIR